jgi:hypothetical protein
LVIFCVFCAFLRLFLFPLLREIFSSLSVCHFSFAIGHLAFALAPLFVP